MGPHNFNTNNEFTKHKIQSKKGGNSNIKIYFLSWAQGERR
jgi:hypothetical protein